jgi:hypothetical protein
MNSVSASLVAGLVLASALSSRAGETLDFSAIDQRVQALQPASDVKRFDEIGWARDIRHALALGRESGRPVFLFTHDGRMNIGRC